MIHNGVSKFLSDVVEKAENLEDLKDTELTAWHYTGQKRTSSIQIVRSPATETHAEFWTRHVPEDWHEKIGEFSPKIYVKGSLSNLSPEDSKMVVNSLADLPNAFKIINVLNIYDNPSGITAMWQICGWGESLRNFLSTKTPASKLHKYIDSLAQKGDVKKYQIRSGETERKKEKGVRVHTKDSDLIKIFREFTNDKNAVLKKLQFGGGTVRDKLEVDYEIAKKLVFPTPLKEITYAEVNCWTYNGNFQETNTEAGAVYASNGELRVKTKTPNQMVGIVNQLI